jgi:hypothetical protein
MNPNLVWQKGKRSNPDGNCVELGRADGSATYVAIRDSKNPSGDVLRFAPEVIRRFVDAHPRRGNN